MNEVISDVKDLEPLVYVEAFSNIKSINGKHLRYGDSIPEDTFKVSVRQEFPIIGGDGKITRKSEVYNLYVGKIYKLDEIYEFSSLYRDDLLFDLESYRTEGINYVVLSRINDGKNNYHGEIFPLRDLDNVVCDHESLTKAVEIITSLHEKMIRVPVYEKGKEFVKKPIDGVNGD